MGETVVFLFLMNDLPEFHSVLKSTLRDTKSEYNGLNIPVSCDTSKANPVLKIIEKQLKVTILPSWENKSETIQNIGHNYTEPELSPESLYKIGTVYDSAEDSDDGVSLEKNKVNDSDNNSIQHLVDFGNKNDILPIKNDSNIFTKSNVTFPRQVPYLVAIFESLLNVTAQTCGGALVSPNWVLTAANCMDQMSFLHIHYNISNTTQSRYSVIAGAFDPLEGGTLHNVTQILQHPANSSTNDTNKSVMALLKIDPPVVNVSAAAIGEARLGDNVMVYGWVGVEADTHKEEVYSGVVPARISDLTECSQPRRVNESSAFCLSVHEGTDLLNQLNTGSPVLALINDTLKLVGIGQTTENNVTMLSTHAHTKWIKEILNSTASRQ